jgi:hypothetical protein
VFGTRWDCKIIALLLHFADRVQNEELFMRRYLRDVYGTEDIEALHGGMPERWQVWLNSEVSVFFRVSRILLKTR